METSEQVTLSQSQIEAFYIDGFNESQVKDFLELTGGDEQCFKGVVVDVGGGVGYFARNLSRQTGCKVRVIDSNVPSIERVRALGEKNIEGVVGDALAPEVRGDEGVICFNLILHHLVGRNDRETRDLQKKAICAWRNASTFIFVNEYIYESFFGSLSGRIIFEITSSQFLSAIAAVVARAIPSLRANTFGVGVRFRSNREWIDLFEECGFSVCGATNGESEPVSSFRRLLLIRRIGRDSFLLRPLDTARSFG